MSEFSKNEKPSGDLNENRVLNQFNLLIMSVCLFLYLKCGSGGRNCREVSETKYEMLPLFW